MTRCQEAIDALTLQISALTEIRDAISASDPNSVERAMATIQARAIPSTVFPALRELRGVPEHCPDNTPVAVSRR